MILDEIAERTRTRVAELKKARDIFSLRRDAENMPGESRASFRKALEAPGISFICEVKKASPSKGIIAPDFPYREIAGEYEEAGAAAVSVLTEPCYFLGSDRYLQEIAERVKLPLLRKDFTVDAYQLYEARILGASAVLLICAILEKEQLREYGEIARSMGMAALVETHTEEEVEMALGAGAEIIGVNNRNLKTFEVDITTSGRLRALIPDEVVFVSESGIKTPEDVAALKAIGTDAVLIGEAFMRSPDKKRQLAVLRGE